VFFPERIASIEPGYRVLEIGPGATPFARSDAFLELRYETDAQQLAQNGYAGFLKTEKPVHFYDGRDFPFADKTFDYVICSHVLEHVPDVPFFLSELMRVAKSGYLEFPTFYYDYLYGIEEHLNLLYFDGKTIQWASKTETDILKWYQVQKFFRRTLENGYERLVRDHAPWFVHGFEWRDEIRALHNPEIFQLNVELPAIHRISDIPQPVVQKQPGLTSFLDPLRTVYHKWSKK
jgi:SAM-dependent methyltransferase